MTDKQSSTGDLSIPVWVLDSLPRDGKRNRHVIVYLTLKRFAVARRVFTPHNILAASAGVGRNSLWESLAELRVVGAVETRQSAGGENYLWLCTAHGGRSAVADGPRAAEDTTSGAHYLSESSKEDSSIGSSVAASRSHSPQRSRTGRPDPFEVTDAMRDWAKAQTPAVDVDAETLQFVDHHDAKGSRFRDWVAAWRTWMRNAQRYSERGSGRGRPDASKLRESSAAGWQARQAERQRRIEEAKREESR